MLESNIDQSSNKIFVVRTSENKLRAGRSKCLPERLAQIRREENGADLVYCAKEEPQAKAFVEKLKKFGILEGCQKNRYSMTLKLVSQLANPVNGQRRGQSSIFEELLATELEPGLTIEAACPVCLVMDPSPPSPHELTHRVLLLRSAGLYYDETQPDEPGLLKLEDPAKFLKALPQLKHIVPFLAQCDGICLANQKPATKQKPVRVH